MSYKALKTKQDQLCQGTPTRLLHIQVSSFTSVSYLHTSLMEETITMHLPLKVSLTAVCSHSSLVSTVTHKQPLQCLGGQPITRRHICRYILIRSMIHVELHTVHLHSSHHPFSERELIEVRFQPYQTSPTEIRVSSPVSRWH